jgi:hypothetical protein
MKTFFAVGSGLMWILLSVIGLVYSIQNQNYGAMIAIVGSNLLLYLIHRSSK